MKVLFITCMYNRPKISKLYLLGLKRLNQIYPLDVIVYCSDQESINLCEEFGVKHYFYKNLPLGEKHNDLFNQAIQFDADYIIHSGDDNVMSNELYLLCLEEFKKDKEYIKTTGLYFYKGGKVLEFHPKNTFGAFRAFKVSMLKDLVSNSVTFTDNVLIGGKTYEQGYYHKLPNYKSEYYKEKNKVGNVTKLSLELYNNDINVGLDFSSESTLKEARVKETIIQTDKPQIIDFKSNQNIWSFEKYYSLCTDAKIEEIYRIIGEKEKEYLKTL
jgi:hypothetical protein